jgi:hypothetical protein
MAGRSRARAAGEHEFLERRQCRVQRVEVVLELAYVLARDLLVAWQREFGADLEELVLNARHTGADRGRYPGLRQQQTERAIRLIDVAECFDPRIRLVDALAVSETRRTVVAGTRIDLAEAMAHNRSVRGARVVARSAYGGMAIDAPANRSLAPWQAR